MTWTDELLVGIMFLIIVLLCVRLFIKRTVVSIPNLSDTIRDYVNWHSTQVDGMMCCVHSQYELPTDYIRYHSMPKNYKRGNYVGTQVKNNVASLGMNKLLDGSLHAYISISPEELFGTTSRVIKATVITGKGEHSVSLDYDPQNMELYFGRSDFILGVLLNNDSLAISIEGISWAFKCVHFKSAYASMLRLHALNKGGA